MKARKITGSSDPSKPTPMDLGWVGSAWRLGSEGDMSWAIWITGTYGSGEAAVARAAAATLRSRGVSARLLDVDTVRGCLSSAPELSEDDRELILGALGYVAVRLVDARIPVIIEAKAAHPRLLELLHGEIPRVAEVRLQCPSLASRRPEQALAVPHAASDGPMSRGVQETPGPGEDITGESGRPPELLLDMVHMSIATAGEAVASLAKRLAIGVPATRERRLGWAIWITGRPGSGKTTVARRVAENLSARGVAVQVLDLASARRAIVGREWATEKQEAFVNRALTLAAKMLTEAGEAVVLDATAPRRAWREQARKCMAHFAEVQLVCSSETCEERERAARWGLSGAGSMDAGGIAAGPDIVVDYEESWHPELRLHTHALDLPTTVEEVLRLAVRLERAARLERTEVERTEP